MVKVGRALVGMIIIGAIFWAHPALAAPYGNGTYNKCSYNCTVSAPSQTKITVSPKLTVTINLANGQTIPYNGYVVIVQADNGQNDQLKQADFYLNGILQYSGTPNSAGAVRWLWQPTQTNGSVTVRVVITDSANVVSTQEFTVTIGDKLEAAATTQTKGPVEAVAGAVLTFVGSLPVPVIYALPYVLFGLLGLNIILLVIQTQREIREVMVLQNILRLERNVAAQKNAFVSLASHYLRTPLSIIEGGVDLLQHQVAIGPQLAEQARQSLTNLRTKVNTLLADSESAAATTQPTTQPQHIRPAWQSPGLYVPIVLIGLFVLAFNYATSHIQSLNINQVTFMLQAVAFTLLAILLYQVVRRLQLRRRDTHGMQQALAHEQAVNQTRDNLIAQGTQLFGADLSALRTIAQQLPTGDATGYITNGIARFQNVLTKFAIASQLKGGQCTDAPTATTIANMVRALPPSLTDAATTRGLRLRVTSDTTLQVRSPKLIGYVLASLIHNAFEYSKPQSSIEIGGSRDTQTAQITVTDHGQGIPPEKLSVLFQPFAQTQDTERFTHEGMGFSLYLDKLIVTYLGGDISITSRPGVATTATIRLPVANA